VYTNFRDNQNLRSGSWVGGVVSQASARYSLNSIYTGVNNGGNVNPAAIAGMTIRSFQQSGTWKAETAKLTWAARFTDGVSSVSVFSGEQFQTNISWPAVAGLQSSTDGLAWASLKNISAEVTSDYGTWKNWSYVTTDIAVPANTNYLLFEFNGTVKATANNVASFGVTAITVNMSNPPSILWRSPVAIVVNNFQFAGALSNSASQSITFQYPLQVNQTYYVDTDPDFPTAKFKGIIVNGSIRTDAIRPDWLPAKSGTETFTFTATTAANIGNMTIVIKWRDRMLFK